MEPRCVIDPRQEECAGRTESERFGLQHLRRALAILGDNGLQEALGTLRSKVREASQSGLQLGLPGEKTDLSGECGQIGLSPLRMLLFWLHLTNPRIIAVV